MAATSNEEMESLLRNFDHIYEEYKGGIAELQLLKLSYHAEVKRCEALEITCNSLKTDNERLTKMYTGSLTKLAYQLEHHARCKNLKQELKRINDEHLKKEDEHKKAMEVLKQDHSLKVTDLEEQIRCCLLQKQEYEATIKQLQQDLAAQKNQINILTSNLKQVNVDAELKYHHEIQDLKDWLLVEHEEKNELIKKLQNTENELLICKAKQSEDRQLSSNHHIETLKQKIMKLRKENEGLKRQLAVLQSKDM